MSVRLTDMDWRAKQLGILYLMNLELGHYRAAGQERRRPSGSGERWRRDFEVTDDSKKLGTKSICVD